MYNYKLKTDANILRSGEDVENRETGHSPILNEEVEKAVQMLKDAKAEILKRTGPGIIDALTVVYQKIWSSGR